MNNGKVCVYVPVEEYRELVKAKRDADCMKAILKHKKRECSFGNLSWEEVSMLYFMFVEQDSTEQVVAHQAHESGEDE